jgi:hypothetical protein
MSKLIYVIAMMVAVIAASTPTNAQQVKRWVDKDGKVHYGDAMNSPSKSESMQVNANRSGYSTDVPKVPDTAKKVLAESKKKELEIDPKHGIPVAAINQCIAYAKEYARIPLNYGEASGKERGLIAQISKTCPNVEISCTIKTRSPEDDRCEAIKPTSKNRVFSGMVNNVRREFNYAQ